MKPSTAKKPGHRLGNNYETELFDRFYDLRNRSFFYRGRARIIEALFKNVFKGGDNDAFRGMKIADIGFGHGSKTSKDLFKGSKIIGVDINLNSLSRIKKYIDSNVSLVNADITALPFKQVFDIVMALDILEHIDDDRKALKNIYDISKKGAILIVMVPAVPSLFGRFDRLAFHKRRYSADDLKQKLMEAGFSVCKISYFISFLFPFIYVYRRLRELAMSKKTDSDITIADMAETKTIPLINGICMMTMIIESKLISALDFPFGSSIVAISKKE